MPVLVEDAAEAVPSVDMKAGADGRLGDRRGQRLQWPGVRDSLVRPMGVVELLELTQSVEQEPLVPDQGPAKQLAAAGLHPAFHDRVHSRHLDTAEHDLDAGVFEHVWVPTTCVTWADALPSAVSRPVPGEPVLVRPDVG
jgi:hypothetical protein